MRGQRGQRASGRGWRRGGCLEAWWRLGFRRILGRGRFSEVGM